MHSQQSAHRLLTAVSVLALLVGLAATGHAFLTRSGFNEDEFFQLSFVNQPFPGFFLQFLRLDQHPPFHFLQLVPWSAVSQADGWMLSNSLLWHGLSCLTLWLVGRAWLGAPAAWMAVALYALTPQVITAATTLRFYAMIPALAVAVWWLNRRLLAAAQPPAWQWWALLVLQLALAYSHAIAFYFLFWLVLAAGLQQRLGEAPAVPGRWRRWLAWQAVAVLLVLPQVLLTGVRGVMARGSGDAVGGNNDPGGLVDHFGGMTAGWAMQWPQARWVGAALFALAVVLGLWQRRSRWLAALVLVGPYVLAMLIGALLTPMFKTPLYSAMLVPFACLCLAGAVLPWQGTAAGAGAGEGAWGASAAAGWLRPAAATLLLAGLAVVVWPTSAHLNRSISPYQALGARLKAELQPGDVVVVPKPYLYWAVARYAISPDWGAPLDVLPKPAGSWASLIQRLGPERAELLRLLPRTQEVVHGGVRFVIGDDARQASAGAARLWVVERVQYPAQVQMDPALVARGLKYDAGMPERTVLRLYSR